MSSDLRLTRRGLMAAGAGALLASGFTPARAALPARLAAIDWSMLETALALNVPLVAATELKLYRRVVAEPAVPAAVADLGLRGSPNLELLASLAPDLILISPFYERYRPQLERIAAVQSFTVYTPGAPAYENGEAVMRALGDQIGMEREAADYIAATAAEIAAGRNALAGSAAASRPLFAISIGDARHVRIFGSDSNFGAVLERFGLTNAWTGRTRYSAFAPVPIEALAQVPEARLVIIPPVPPDVTRILAGSRVWQTLPAVREGRVHWLEPVDHFGALPAARRFARLLTASLLSAEAHFG
ncbi:ABC transporter substrate-binding protein [Radicibacter daui]|uniref:ABC transporter substrate-binding protein n=1 Tax=Radicibacter daui TaxID=3064829 RepID=UPI004046C170